MVAATVTQTRPSEFCVQLAHCGDSRAVFCVGQELICSEDHKPQREDETERIRAAGGTVEHGSFGGGPLRVDGALAVSRAMGDFQFKPIDMAPSACKVTALPEVMTIDRCSPGDWLLLACDGVFDVMENEDVQQFVSSRLRDAGETADGGQIMVDLLKLCLNKGSKDNCTACLIQLLPGGAARHSKELLQGPWAEASPEVQAKYAEFFASQGFQDEAQTVQSAISSGQAGASRDGHGRARDSSSASAESPDQDGAGPASLATAEQQQLVALAKALHAMRSSQAGQGAWRAQRSDGGDGSSST